MGSHANPTVVFLRPVVGGTAEFREKIAAGDFSVRNYKRSTEEQEKVVAFVRLVFYS